MRITAALLLSCAASLASGFAPAVPGRPAPLVRPSSAVVRSAGAASTHEEDLDLTRQAILAHIASSDVDSGGVVDDDDDDAGAGGVAEESGAPQAEEAQPPKKAKKKKTPPPPAAPVEIDISKLNIVVGVIAKAWEHEAADKLFCEEIDVGEPDGPRHIASGLRAHYAADDLTGRRVLVLANLKSRKLVGFPSHGMVLCASTDDGSKVVFVDPPADAAIGERVRVEGYDGEPATENQVLKKKMLDVLFPHLRTDGNGVASYKGVPLTAGTGVCVAEGGLGDAQVS